jgi:hypothetical protein
VRRRLLVSRMKRAIVCIALSLTLLVSAGVEASVPISEKDLAKVSLVRLDRETKLKFQATSDEGFVLVAIQDCVIQINGTSTSLKTGDYKTVSGKRGLEIAQSGLITIPLVLVEVVSARQPLTIEATTLAPNQELEDASDRNSTLLVAIAPLRLRDVSDLAEEGAPWKASPQRKIELQKGQTAWLKEGMHRVRNMGNSAARFIIIEW